MYQMRALLLFVLSCTVFSEIPLNFSGTGMFEVKKYSGTIGMSDSLYDSYLHWSTGSGVVFMCEVVDSATNRVSICAASSNKYLSVPPLQGANAESSKVKLVELSAGAAFDLADLGMQFYIEGTGGVFKIRSAATGGYLTMSTGAFIRAAQLGSDGKYSDPAPESAGLSAGFAIQARPMNIKAGDAIKIKDSSGGYLGFNDAGTFVILPAVDGVVVPQLKVASYDAKSGVVSFKVQGQSLCSVATTGGSYGGITFTFAKSLTNPPAQFVFCADPLIAENCYLQLITGASRYYLRRSSSSPAVIASTISDFAQRYTFSFEAGTADSNDILSNITLLSQLNLSNVRDDFDNRFGKFIASAATSVSDWEFVGKMILPYVRAAMTLSGWTTPGGDSSPSLRDVAVLLLQKIPNSFSQSKNVADLIQQLKDIPVFLAAPALPPTALNINKGDIVALRLADGSFLSKNVAGGISAIRTSVYDPAVHFFVSEYNKNVGRICFGSSGKYVRLVPESASFKFAETMQLADIVCEASQPSKFSFYYAGTKIVFDAVKLGALNGQPASSFELVGKLSDQQKLLDGLTLSPVDLTAAKTIVEQIFIPLLSAQGLSADDVGFILGEFINYIKKIMELFPGWETLPIVSTQGTLPLFLRDYVLSIMNGITASESAKKSAQDFITQLNAAVSLTRQNLLNYKTDTAVLLKVLSVDESQQKTLLVDASGAISAAPDAIVQDPSAHFVVTGYDALRNTLVLKCGSKFFSKSRCSFSDAQQTVAFALSAVKQGGNTYYYLCDSVDISKRLTVTDSGAISWGPVGSLFLIMPLKPEELALDSIVVTQDVDEVSKNIKTFATVIDAALGKDVSLLNILNRFDRYTQECFSAAVSKSLGWNNVIEDAWAAVQNDAKNVLLKVQGASPSSSVAVLVSTILNTRSQFRLRIAPTVSSLPSVPGNYWIKLGSGYLGLYDSGVTAISESKQSVAPFRIDTDDSSGSRRIAIFSRKHGKYLTVKPRSLSSDVSEPRIAVEKTTLDPADNSIWFMGQGVGFASRDLYLRTSITNQYVRCGVDPNHNNTDGLYAYWAQSYTDFTHPDLVRFIYPITNQNNATLFSFEYEASKALAITAGTSLQLQSLDGDLLYVSTLGVVVLGKRSLHDPASQFVVESYDASRGTMAIKNGAKYLDVDVTKNTLKLSATKVLLRVSGDADVKTISFLNAAGQAVSVASLSGGSASSFKFINPIESVYQGLVGLYQAMAQPLTVGVIQDAFSGILRTFLVTTRKAPEDWVFFVDFLTVLLTKASADITTWKLPAIDIVDQGKTKRISACEYAALFMGYIADPFSAAPVVVQNKARILQQTLMAQLQQATTVAPVPAAGASFSPGSLVVLLAADGSKTLFVSDQGIAQFLPGITKFNTCVQAQVVAHDAPAKKIKISYAGRLFDLDGSSFSRINAEAAPFFSLETTADPSVCYLSLGQEKRLVIGDRFSSGCSLNAQGTPFKIIPLNSVYVSLSPVKMPATRQEFENSLKTYFVAFEGVRDSSEDMTFIFQGLKKYCEAVAVTPDWFMQMNGAVIVNDTPLNYVKTNVQTMLTLRARYVGLTDALKILMQQFIAGAVFAPMQISNSLTTGALCYLKVGDASAVVLDASGICKSQPVVSLLEPAIHVVIDRFDAVTASLSISLNGKKMAANGANKLVPAEVAGVFRVMTEASGRQSLVSAQNKKLRYDQESQSVAFADTGTIIEIAFMQAEQRVLDSLGGDTKKDLKLLEKVLLQVRMDARETDFVVTKLINYAQQSSQDISWYTAVGIDDRNPKTTMREYALMLLRRVSDAVSIFTAVTPALKDRISVAVKELENDVVLYARQIDLLDGLARKLSESSMITLSSELVATLNVLIENVMTKGNADLRELLLQKVESYADAAIVTGLAQASDAAKMAWRIQNMRFMDRLLIFAVQDAAAWQDKFDAVKTKLFARVFDSTGSEKIALMHIVLNSSVKKLVTEGVSLSIKSTSWKSLKQLLSNLLFDVSQQLTNSPDDATSTSLVNVKKVLDALLVSAGMKKEEVVVAPSIAVDAPTPALEPVVAIAAASVPEVAPVVQSKPRRALLPGMMSAAVAVELSNGEAGEGSLVESSSFVNDGGTANTTPLPAVSRSKHEI